ncbi:MULTISPECIES: YjjG family noncanonical pyrimidine nucleotidase [unclassified Algibacter]|uniref:YjjG family noncanonical pyrimidine nucleotidase n=1 Tax=unclassified Algibacter TaxID=2615009 RepID=UPI00131AEC5A|nr:MULTISPECIES: YjjG family noncanonical pyrimidine nucleotidase [unclassified Algibacter]MCL5129085.1 YjjG family noncanonical pyrimidine nucleotidase [Algibacter sp. L4_22]
MKIKNITDVFFDLDHTLWDFDRNSALTFEKIFEINKIEVEINQFLESYVPINLKYWKLYREDKVSKESLRFGRLNEAFSVLGVEVEHGLINKLSDDYIEYLSSFNYLFDNTLEILDYLNENYRLHVITNGFDEVQHKKMAKSNILHYFETVTNSEMVGVKKPNPKIFKHALELANAKAENSIMIGDSFEADIIGAKNIGMDVIFFDINNIVLEEDIKQISELLSLRHYL